MKHYKRFLSITLALVVTFAGARAAHAATYYVSDSTGSDSYTAAQAQNPNTPWKTIDKVESSSSTIQPGDSILFKRGDVFTGVATNNKVFTWSKSGTASARITFGAYGTGAKPQFQYPIPSPLPSNWAQQAQNRIYMYITGSYITIDGLNFTDPTMSSSDKTTNANMGAAIYFSYYGNVTANYEIVRNSDFSKIGLGIVLNGNNGLIENNTFTDLKNLVNTCSGAWGTCPAGSISGGAYEDYGANGITLDGNDHTIQYNYFSGNWAASYDFGWNGGAIEAYSAGTLNRMKVLYNTFVDNGGIIEYGSGNNASINDNLFAYNLAINNGDIAWTQYSTQFTTQASNIQFFNNTIIENSNSRFSKGANQCAGIPVGNGYPTCMYGGMLFAYGSTPPSSITTVYNLKNNVYDVSTQFRVKGSGSDDKFIHENNVYKLSGGATQGFGSLNASEKTTSAAVVNSSAGAVPTATSYTTQPQTNFALTATSIAINAGTNVGFTTDLAGAAINGAPDAGTYEYASGTPTDTTAPTVAFSSPAAGATVSGTTTVSATASDNVGVASVKFSLDGVLHTTDVAAPYDATWITTGVANGTHTWTVVATDMAGNTASATRSFTVNNTTPDTTAPVVSISAPFNGSTVTGTITAQATATDAVGVVGVQFKVDGVNLGSEDTTSPYTASWNTSTYSNGTHTITAVARDAAGNIGTATATVTISNTVADTVAPTTSFTAPAAGATVSGNVEVTADASDNVGVTSVTFKLGDAVHTVDTTAPYSATWVTTTVPNDAYTWTIIAKDAAGNEGVKSRTFVVSNTTAQNPSVPTNLTVTNVGNDVTLTWTPSTGSVGGYKIYRNGAVVGQSTTTSYSETVATGSYTYTVAAYNVGGSFESAQSSPVTISTTPLAVMYQTTAKVNVRSNPTTWSTGVVLGQQAKGAIGTVITGTSTVVANGFTWVKLDFTTGADGWVVTKYLKYYDGSGARTGDATTSTTARTSTDLSANSATALELLQQAARATTTKEANQLIQQAQALLAQ